MAAQSGLSLSWSQILKTGFFLTWLKYRPISLTCTLCKSKEHIIASNWTRHFEKHNVLYDLQHGFREHRSCETQLIQLVMDLTRSLTEGKQSDLILLDFSEAFDKVSHLKLLYKLQMHGIQGKTLHWIQSFLVGRSQTVVLHYLKVSVLMRSQFLQVLLLCWSFMALQYF